MPKDDRLKFKADPEDGITPIANLLLEAVAIAKLSGKEKGAILYLWRRTYGWEDKITGKRIKERRISLDEWRRILQTDEYAASKVLASLVQKNILNRQFLGPGKGYIYTMNTYIDSWNSNCLDHDLLQNLTTLVIKDKGSKKQQPLSKVTTLVKDDKTTLVKSDNPPLSKVTRVPDTNSRTLNKDIKERLNKDIIQKKGPLKKIYGQFKNVLLTDEECQKLEARFGSDADEKIEALSEGIESRGYKYQSHYAAILNWDRRDKKGQAPTLQKRVGKLPTTEELELQAKEKGLL